MNRVLKSTLFALYAACCLSGSAVAAAADTLFSVRYQGIAHDALYDICFSGTKGFAVGIAGTLFTSDDQGESWQPQGSLGPEAILGLYCGADTVLAVGQGGAIHRKRDGEWQRMDSGSDARLLDVSANRNGLAVAVGGFGTVLRSMDGGDSWEPLAFDWETLLNDFLEPHIYDVAVSDAGVITIVGEFAMVLRSVDAGETWEMVHRGDASLFALHLSGDVGYAVGQNGLVLKTGDGGQTWARLDAGTDANLLDVLVDRDGVIHVTGIRTLLQSHDGGNTWAASKAGDISSRWYQSLGLSGSGVFMVGHSGRIVRIK
jgi:photosystem II stability/assembly factor-like uncharacterized protein